MVLSSYPEAAFPEWSKVRRLKVATRPKLTYEDYLHFPEGERYELIDGEAWMVPSPNTRHQEMLLSLAVRVRNHLESHGGGLVFMAPRRG